MYMLGVFMVEPNSFYRLADFIKHGFISAFFSYAYGAIFTSLDRIGFREKKVLFQLCFTESMCWWASDQDIS